MTVHGLANLHRDFLEEHLLAKEILTVRCNILSQTEVIQPLGQNNFQQHFHGMPQKNVFASRPGQACEHHTIPKQP